MRVCIIGSGLAGLSAAHYLSAFAEVDVTIVEASEVPGGRANVEEGAEHCPRIFLNDYSYVFDILRAVPMSGGGTLMRTLQPLHRMVRVNGGWLEVSHLYRIFASEVPLRERLKQALASRRIRLVGEEGYGRNTNRYGSLRNYSLRSLARMMANLLESKTGLTLDGPTDLCLIHPWIRHLEARGVGVRTGAPVERLREADGGVELTVAGRPEYYNSVLVTAFLPDAKNLLDASGLDHTLRDGRHVHCKALTVRLDPAERILREGGPGIFCHAGINIVLQPRHHRCVVLCTWSASTDVEFVLGRVREYLGLTHDFVDVKVRDNQLPCEGVFAADYVPARTVLRGAHPNIHFAGSYVCNSYPLDSGEGAARSAFNATARMRAVYGLRPRAGSAGVAAR